MILWGVAMVRNEAELVEAFVRHNLTLLDGMLIVDHNSTDATSAILASLCVERLPVVVMRSDSPGYLQAEVTSTAARQVFARTRADFVFPLDADEFLKVGSRAELERFLAGLRPDTHALFDWPTYAPPLDRPARDVVALARAARRYVKERLPVGKVAVARCFAAIADAYIGQGNHEIYVGKDPGTARRLPVHRAPDSMCVAHLPARGEVQHALKFGVRRLARIAAGRDYPPSANFRRAYEQLRAGRPTTPDDMLRPYVDGYYFDESRPPPTTLPTVDDPFIADITLRYTPPLPDDPLPTVLAAVEGLTRRLADYRRRCVRGGQGRSA